MSHRSQDIPIRPRYGYLDQNNDEDSEQEKCTENQSSIRPHTTSGRNIPMSSSPASSYTEIPFLAQYAGKVPEHLLNNSATCLTSPVVAKNDVEDEEEDTESDDDVDEEKDMTDSKESGFSNDDAKVPKRPVSLQYDSTFPYELEGATSNTGEMRHFVAHNLEAKLREGSPMRKEEYSSEHTTPSAPGATGLLTRRFLQSQNAPPPAIDANVINDIELEAQYLATSVDNLMENLGNLLHSISSITADNVEVHKNAVNKLTDSMDANIKCMYTIMAKTEEITKSMRPTEQLGQRIREIKRLVDMFDNAM